MKIYDRDLTGAAAAESGRSQETQKTDRGSSTRTGNSGGGSGDRIEFSNTLSQVSRALAQFQTDRASRLDSLTAQFQAGQYQPDSLAISSAMVAQSIGRGGD